MNKSVRVAKTALAALSLALISGIALADSTGTSSSGTVSFMPASTDATVQILRLIFGPIIDIVQGGSSSAPSGSSQPVIGAMLEIFNAAVLFIGVLLITYATLAGAAQTAHDGEVLGKRWSSMWLPVRTALSIGVLLPVSQGYAAIQVIVFWLALQGVGVANFVWGVAVDNLASSGAPVPMVSTKTEKLANSIFLSQVCAEAMNAGLTKAAGGTAPPASDLYQLRTASATNFFIYKGATKYTWGPESNPEECGGFAVQSAINTQVGNAVSSTAGTSQGWSPKTVINGFSGWFSNDRVDITNGFIDAQKTHLSNMEGALGSAAKQLVDHVLDPTQPMPAPGAIRDAAIQYDLDMQNTATQLYTANGTGDGSSGNVQQNQNQFKQDAKKDGWLYAGAWFFRIMWLSEVIKTAANDEPPTIDPQVPILKANVAAGHDVLNTSISYASEYLKLDSQQTGTALAQNASSTGQSGLDDQYGRMMNAGLGSNYSNTSADNDLHILSPSLSTIQKIVSETTEGNVMGSLKSLGDIMMGSVSTYFAADLTSKAWSWFRSKTGGDDDSSNKDKEEDGKASSVSIFLAAIIFAIAAGGVTLSIILPTMPYILWIAGIIGWLVLLMESLVAAPLWAIMHAAPEGDGIAGSSARQGYMIVLSLSMRPGLMVFGLVAAMVLLDVIGVLIAKTFTGVIATLSASGVIGLFSLLAIIGLYCILLSVLVFKAFSMIHVIPDKVLRWVGGGGEQLGEAQTGEEVKGGARNVVLMGSQTAQSVGRSNAAQERVAKSTGITKDTTEMAKTR